MQIPGTELNRGGRCLVADDEDAHIQRCTQVEKVTQTSSWSSESEAISVEKCLEVLPLQVVNFRPAQEWSNGLSIREFLRESYSRCCGSICRGVVNDSVV